MSNLDGPDKDIRLVFELSRAEHPRLYDDLIRFPKGTRRINRLRILAYDGFLVQCGFLSLASAARGSEASPGDDDSAARTPVTNDLFDPHAGD